MFNKRDKVFDEHDYYNIFVVYDLLRDLLGRCKRQETDLVWDTCKEIYEWYLTTKFSKQYNKSEYDCLQDFIDDSKINIVATLYNNLDFPIIEWQQKNGYIK